MRWWIGIGIVGFWLVVAPAVGPAGAQGLGVSSVWLQRMPVEPDPSRVVVPEGYQAGVFARGLDTPSSATVDARGNLWVVISGRLLSGPELEASHVKVFDPDGNLVKEIGKGSFRVLNEIDYCPENGVTYLTEFGWNVWEIRGLDAEPRRIVVETPLGDHVHGGVTCRDGYLYFARGMPSNTGFADPDNHGWTEIPEDPFWVKRSAEGQETSPRDAPCRDIVHTGLNIRSSDGRLTGAYLPVGVPAQPGMVVEAQVPCSGSIMRVALGRQREDGTFKDEDMEVYAMGFRSQSGLAFGPVGTKWASALAVSDNGGNEIGNRRIANSAEKLYLVTEQGQDAGYPDKDGFLFVSSKRYGAGTYHGSPVVRPYPDLYLGDEPFVPKRPPYRFQPHLDGVRGVPLIIANPNPDGYINPILEWDTNSPIDGIAWSAGNFGADNDLFGAVFGPLDTGPESLIPNWPAVLRVEFLEPAGIKWTLFARNVEMGPNAYQRQENRGGLERPNDVVFSNDGRTMYVVDYGEVYVDFTMPQPFYTVPGSGVIWTITYQGPSREAAAPGEGRAAAGDRPG